MASRHDAAAPNSRQFKNDYVSRYVTARTRHIYMQVWRVAVQVCRDNGPIIRARPDLFRRELTQQQQPHHRRRRQGQERAATAAAGIAGHQQGGSSSRGRRSRGSNSSRGSSRGSSSSSSSSSSRDSSNTSRSSNYRLSRHSELEADSRERAIVIISRQWGIVREPRNNYGPPNAGSPTPSHSVEESVDVAMVTNQRCVYATNRNGPTLWNAPLRAPMSNYIYT